MICESRDIPIVSQKLECPRLFGFGDFEIIRNSRQGLLCKNATTTVQTILQSYGVSHYVNKDVVALNAEGEDNCDVQVIYGINDTEIVILTLRRYDN